MAAPPAAADSMLVCPRNEKSCAAKSMLAGSAPVRSAHSSMRSRYSSAFVATVEGCQIDADRAVSM